MKTKGSYIGYEIILPSDLKRFEKSVFKKKLKEYEQREKEAMAAVIAAKVVFHSRVPLTTFPCF